MRYCGNICPYWKKALLGGKHRIQLEFTQLSMQNKDKRSSCTSCWMQVFVTLVIKPVIFAVSIIWCLFLQSLLYKKVHEAQFRSHLANEMMMYHMKVEHICASHSVWTQWNLLTLKIMFPQFDSVSVWGRFQRRRCLSCWWQGSSRWRRYTPALQSSPIRHVRSLMTPRPW